MREQKPLLVSAAVVHSCDPAGAPADAVLLRGARVAAVGQREELLRQAPMARRLELPGACITPGLTDAHVHLTEWALSRREADLSQAASPEAAVAALGAHERPGAGWVRGRGWNAHLWQGRGPDRQLLDAIFPDRPVALQSHDMHSLWVNSAALAAAGITAGTPDPAGGQIERAADGTPTGVLRERAGELVVAVIPPPTPADVLAAVRAAQSELHRLGMTGVHTFPGIAVPDPEPLAVLTALRDAGELRLRVLAHLRFERLDDALGLGLRSGFGDHWLRLGAVKLFLDGALGSRTAWMRAPYQGTSDCGVAMLPTAEFRALAARAASGGIATAVHAIGDAAVALALDVLADPALRGPALPHRIEHVQCCPPERLADAGRAGIVCSVQPSHLITDWRAADRHWGQERARCTYAFASLARGGATLVFGSDAPVEPIDPRLGLFAAVQRQDTSGAPAAGWQPQERLDALAALHGFTTGPALAAGAAGEQGVLAPGACADLVVWDRDPLTCPPSELLDLRVLATIVAGEIVHD